MATPSVQPRRPSVAVHDVADVMSFVHATLVRFERDSQVSLSDDEREELVGEGLVIMYELAAKFEPHRPGYRQAGRFSGFAAHFLPKRLGDAWHRHHEEHRYVTRPDGKREWRYFRSTISIDGMRDRERSGNADATSDAGDRVDGEFLDSRYWVPVAQAA